MDEIPTRWSDRLTYVGKALVIVSLLVFFGGLYCYLTYLSEHPPRSGSFLLVLIFGPLGVISVFCFDGLSELLARFGIRIYKK